MWEVGANDMAKEIAGYLDNTDTSVFKQTAIDAAYEVLTIKI